MFQAEKATTKMARDGARVPDDRLVKSCDCLGRTAREIAGAEEREEVEVVVRDVFLNIKGQGRANSTGDVLKPLVKG